jgi:hypothetical protein
MFIHLENGFNLLAQILLEQQRKTYTSIVLQWILPLQTEFLIIGWVHGDNNPFSFWKTFMVPFQAQIFHGYQVAYKHRSINCSDEFIRKKDKCINN